MMVTKNAKVILPLGLVYVAGRPGEPQVVTAQRVTEIKQYGDAFPTLRYSVRVSWPLFAIHKTRNKR